MNFFNYISDLPHNAVIELPISAFDSHADWVEYQETLVSGNVAQWTTDPATGQRVLTKL